MKKLLLFLLIIFLLPASLHAIMLEGSAEGGYTDRYEAYYSRFKLGVTQSLEPWIGPFKMHAFFQYDIFATRDSETRTWPSTYSYGFQFSFHGFYFQVQHFAQPLVCDEVTRQLRPLGREMTQIGLGAKFKIGHE